MNEPEQWRDWVFWLSPDASSEENPRVESADRVPDFLGGTGWNPSRRSVRERLAEAKRAGEDGQSVVVSPLGLQSQFGRRERMTWRILLSASVRVPALVHGARVLRSPSRRTMSRVYVLPRDGGYVSSDSLRSLLSYVRSHAGMSMWRRAALAVLARTPFIEHGWPYQVWILGPK
jgi:hypothetical protein